MKIKIGVWILVSLVSSFAEAADSVSTVPSRAVETPREITVFSWNTEHYDFKRWSPVVQRELEQNMFALIRAANPDIFLIQETYGSFERFKAAFPDYHAVLQSECNSVFSKFPIAGSRRLWVDKKAKTPIVFNTPVLEFADVMAGELHLRVSSFAMFWQPACIYTPAELTVPELLALEAAPQKYPLTPRPQAIREVVSAMSGYLAEKDRIPMIIGGDFNSLSHLDWTKANGGAEGHCGRAVPWPVSRMMVGAGFVDAYRAVHPDEVKEYGVTCPIAGNDPKRPRPLVRLDYVYSAGAALKPIASETIHGVYHKPFTWQGRSFTMFPSDHAPVLVRYAVTPATLSPSSR